MAKRWRLQRSELYLLLFVVGVLICGVCILFFGGKRDLRN